MSLIPYKRKRNFKKTPEPPPKVASANGKLHFVVQKHDASHLHFDFRLENRGVLKSWAVPKGVSLDPHIKRLAMEVEDHPFDYRSFEGTIPEGNYGAGTVMVWDNGEYYVDPSKSREENEKLIEEALKKGNLKFYLNGQKLKGMFALVRLRPKPHDKKMAWLLIKKEDEFANQPIAHEDESVKTGRTLDEIAEHKKVTKKSVVKGTKKRTKQTPTKSIDLFDAPKIALPEHIVPMMATLVDEAFDRPNWIFEVKWDGYRMISQIEDKKVRVYSRNDQTYTDHFELITHALEQLPFDAVLDGEVVVVDDKGVSNFQLLQNYLRHQQGSLLYYVFDILYYNGHDLRGLTLQQRKSILHALIQDQDPIRLSHYMENQGKSFFEAARHNGLEGIIAKDLNSKYQTGVRSRQWLKIKAINEQEAIICGFTAPRGSRSFFGSLILGIYKGGDLTYIGHTGSGFNQDTLKDMNERLKPLITSQCPFKQIPRTNQKATWVKPVLLCQIKFQEWTNEGSMRQPIFLGLREDKKPIEAKPEKPQPLKRVVQSKPEAAPQKNSKDRSFKTKAVLTHLEKVFWPKEGYTKGDVINYYQTIAPWILPYLKDRPQSLLRNPNGIDEKGFFQKNINYEPPGWIKTVPVESDSRKETTRYLICNDKDTLAYMNNLGCIEINPWSSTTAKLEYPDFLVLDFDPVNVDFKVVIDVVLSARKVMDALKIEGCPKTSGSRGLHVYIPLHKKYTYDQTKDFAHILCMAIAKQNPKVTSLERSPSKRQGLIYLDYLQNHYSATMAAPYSLRPKPGATVSTPLEWREVNPTLDPSQFNIKTMAERLSKKGDLFKTVLGPGIDMVKTLDLLQRKFLS